MFSGRSAPGVCGMSSSMWSYSLSTSRAKTEKCYLHVNISTVGVVMKKVESRVRFARPQAALDVWVGMISATMDWYISEIEELYLSPTGSWYHLRGRKCQDQARQIHFAVWKVWSPQCFMLVFCSEAICLLVCRASHTHAHYSTAEKKKLAKLRRVNEVSFPLYSVFLT